MYRIGYPNTRRSKRWDIRIGHWARIVLVQSWLLAILSYLPAALISFLLYELTAGLSRIPTSMTWERFWGVLGLAFLMCSASGIMAMLRLWRAEPASLF